MIQLPQNDLRLKLDEIQAKADPSDPEKNAAAAREYDFALTGAWQALKGSPAKDALDILLGNMEAEIVSNITDPRVPESGRSFLAGQLRVVNEIQAGIEKFMTFDPSEVDYAAEQESQQFGDPDVQDGYEGDANAASF